MTTLNWSDYSLDELRAHATMSFRVGGGSRPDVLLIEINNQKAVLKDHNATDKLFGLLLGRLLRWRECKALRQLDQVAAIPKLLNEPDTRSFLMEYRPAEPSTRLTSIEVDWPAFFVKLDTTLEQVHQAGVAHNDLRNPTNILVDKNGDPVLVDLVACFIRGRKWNLPNQWLFNKFSQVDLSAMGKLKARVAPELGTASDIQTNQIAGRFGLLAKDLGKLIRYLSRKLFTN